MVRRANAEARLDFGWLGRTRGGRDKASPTQGGGARAIYFGATEVRKPQVALESAPTAAGALGLEPRRVGEGLWSTPRTRKNALFTHLAPPASPP